MIRFLNLKNQIINGVPDFAFYDTIDDRIMQFNGVQVFDSREEFMTLYSYSVYVAYTLYPLTRFLSVIPDNYFNEESNEST